MIKSIIKHVCILLAVTVVLAVFPGCTKNKGIPGGDFKEQESIYDSLSAEGNTTVTLKQDEAVDMTGIDISGRKEIILNNNKLTITGSYKFNTKGILDIKNGEGFNEGILDISVLEFDLTRAPANNTDNIPIIEISSGVSLVEPVYIGRIGIRDYGILKEIHIKSVE